MKEWIYFYLGCECQDYAGKDTILTTGLIEYAIALGGVEKITLFLRPLTDMTQQEHEEYFETIFRRKGESRHQRQAQGTLYLIKKRFNLFDPEWKHCLDITQLSKS